MLAVILTLIIGSGPRLVERTETVDVIEINHVIYPDGREFNQVIYWRWHRSKLHVAAWRLATGTTLIMRENGVYVDRFKHRDGMFYEVKATSRRERTTDYDPELHDRQSFPWEMRQWSLWSQ